MDRKTKFRTVISMVLSGLASVIMVNLMNGGFTNANSKDKIIVADSFGLSDKQGRIRAGLSMDKNELVFFLADEDGKKKLSISLVKDQARIAVNNKLGVKSMEIGIDKSDQPEILLRGQTGRLRCMLKGFHDTPMLTMVYDSGEKAMSMYMENDSRGVLKLTPKDSKTTTMLVGDSKASGLSVINSYGKQNIAFVNSDKLGPKLSMQSSWGKAKCEVTANVEGGSQIALRNSDGLHHVLISAEEDAALLGLTYGDFLPKAGDHSVVAGVFGEAAEINSVRPSGQRVFAFIDDTNEPCFALLNNEKPAWSMPPDLPKALMPK